MLSIAGDVLLSYRVQEKELVETKRLILKDIMEKIQTDVDETAALAASRAVMFIAEAFRKEEREWLIGQMTAMFSKQKQKYFLSELQFHKAPAKTFLRIHKADGYGEDLSDLRQTVVSTNNLKSPQKGLELGRARLGLRGVVPVFYEKEHIGSLEFASSFKSLINKTKKITGTDISIFVNKNLYKRVCALISNENK